MGIITDDGNDKNSNTNSDDIKASEPMPKNDRKRDKLRAFVQSSWSYWSGSENDDDENDENAKKQKQKKSKSVKEYITNKLASQWMIEQDVIDIANIPSNEMIQLFFSKLQNGKNEILFSIKTHQKWIYSNKK